MSILRTVRTARVEHDCDWCHGEIEPGTRYVEAKLPPGGDLGNGVWLRSKRHLRRECYPFGSQDIPVELLAADEEVSR